KLPTCSVLSLAWHSAATYAAAAIDPSCFRGLQFPEPDGPLTGFAIRNVGDCALDGATVAHAERSLGARLVAIGGATDFSENSVLAAGAELVVYGEIAPLQATAPVQSAARGRLQIGRRLLSLLRRGPGRPLGSTRSSPASLSPHWLYSWSAPRISMPSLEVGGLTPSTSWLQR